MTDHASERAEVERIDFLLDELARAVERGEVHRASYDLLASRYLSRRAELVSLITGQPQPGSTEVAATGRPVAGSPGAPPVSGQPGAPPAGASSGAPPVGGPGFTPQQVATSRPRPASRPVDWTTVLLFLGAFLVIVASAVFSVAVWGLLDTLAKFGFLASLTAGFYAAGWWARTKLGLTVGSTALTVVASSMLLFDGWILIDGYELSGPWPWAALLLGCSLVYWYTETRISSGFFGVIGAGAQVAWWWLLGSGLGLPGPVRIAGLAVVAAVWQLAGERGAGRTGVAPLARVLRWAAPVLAAGSALAVIADLVFLGSADMRAVVSAGVVSAASGTVAWRALSIWPRGRAARASVSALVQAPVFVAAWLAAAGAHAWWIAGAFAAAAVIYDVLGLTGRGTPFVVAGLAAELCAVLEVAFVLDASAVTTVVVVAALGALWALSARLLDRMAADGPADEHHARAAVACEAGAFVLLVCASAALPAVTLSFPLPGAALSRSDVLGYVGVLAAWWAAATIRPRGVTAFAGSLFSFSALAAVVAWAWPSSTPGLFALPLALLAGVWLASARALTPAYGETWAAVTRWSARATLVLVTLAAVIVAPIFAAAPRTVGLFGAAWDPVVLLLVAAAVAAADAAAGSCGPVAAFSGVSAVLAASFAAAAIADLTDAVWTGDAQALAVGAAACAVAAKAWWLRRGEHARLAPWFALSAALAASLLIAGSFTVASLDAVGDVVLALAAGLLAAAWGIVAATSSQWFACAAGLALAGTVAALTPGAGEWTRVLAFGSLGLALGASPLVPPFGSRGPAAKAGASLALVSVVPYFAAVSSGGVDAQPGVVALLMAASGIAVSSAARRFEPGYHFGGAVAVIAVWSEVSIVARHAAPAALYAVPLALYFAATGYLHVRLDGRRRYPEALDALAVSVGVGYPLIVALQAGPERALADSLWAVVTALAAIGAGIALKVRWWRSGGVAGLALAALFRSFSVIAEYWWAVLGAIGIAMLVIALTWQRQRAVVAEARTALKRSFEGWR